MFSGTFFGTRLLHDILKLIGIRCDSFDGEFVNSIWPNYRKIGWWLVSIVGGETVNLHTFYEKICIKFICMFLDTFFETRLLPDILELVVIRCYSFGGESVNLVWLNYHKISWWLVLIIDWETINLRWVFLVHSPDMGSGTRIVIVDCERHRFYLILVFLLWYL